MSTFIIQELRRDGTGQVVDGEARFEWTSGARSCPRGSWKLSLKVKTSREDYSGDVPLPTEQVLNVAWQPFTLEGEWIDQWNYAGFAREEMARFEAMVKRSRLCRFSIDDQAIVGLVVDFTHDYRWSGRIGYSIQVSPHYRESDGERKPVASSIQPTATATDYAQQVVNRLDELRAALESMPIAYMPSGTPQSLMVSLAAMEFQGAAVQAVVAQRTVLGGSTAAGAANPLSLASQACYSLAKLARGLLPTLGAMTAATELAFADAVVGLQVEASVKSAAALARFLAIDAYRAAASLAALASPAAVAIYRPQAGESLYSVSNRFFGAPHHWRDILLRNNLHSTTLEGTELLIIPAVR